jgi:fused signal recognition particle receptor
MAGFNWFRRAFNKSDTPDPQPDSSQQETQAQPAETAKAEPSKAEPAETSQQMSPEDYLKWAKAAYQNIQKQQQVDSDAEADSATAEDTATPAEAATRTSVVVEAATASEPEATPETAPTLEPESAGEDTTTAVTEIPASAETPATAESAITEATAPPEVEAESASTAESVEVAASAPETPSEIAMSPDVAASDGAAPEPEVPEPEAAFVEDREEVAASAVAEETLEAVTPPPTPEEAGSMATMAAIEPEEPDAATTSLPESPEVSSTEEPGITSASDQPAAVPFWARAEEERQQRLERLQETAIVEPEPEPEPVATTTTPAAPVLPDIDLDEAFIWSAEVLAAQGRRPDDVSIEEITWLNKLRQGLNKTRLSLVNQLKAIVGQGPLNDDAIMEIEALLLQADVGVEATDKVIEALQNQMRQEVLPPDQAIAFLKSILRDMLDAPLEETHNLLFVPEKETLNIWLMTGVNGAGKTTTIGKLAHIAKKSGYNTLIAAADTFRAAAVEQVKAWGARSEVEVIANPGKNTDPAAVVYDAIAAANSREIELLLVDTAGRLQNKKNLMDELAKIRRIVDKKAPNAKVESLLVLDATLGQNGLRQAEVFAEAANLSGVVLTKLDGTAKGGWPWQWCNS